MNDFNKTHYKPIRLWLYGVASMVFAMVIIGAITRLTESGLSMVEWRPFIGALPPVSESEWLRVFKLYKQSPEYQKINTWMSLNDFKSIFFWEWLHRFWGRMIGLAFALPLVYFWLRGALPKDNRWHFAGLLALGGAQGLMGWVMVKSGLIDNPAVSHYRLAAHLILAFGVFALLILKGMSLGQTRTPLPRFCIMRHFAVTCVLIIITILWGAFVAGLDAGKIYNTDFPLMGGAVIPAEVSRVSDFWQSPAGVQMAHRWLAMFTVIFTLLFCARMIVREHIKFPAIYVLGGMILLQMCLGIATLISNVAIPLAVLHQTGALILIFLLCRIFHRFRYTFD